MGSRRKTDVKKMSCLHKFFELRLFLAIAIMVSLIICTSIAFGYYLHLYQNKTETTNEISNEYTRDSFEETVEDIESYSFVSRSEYNALPARKTLQPFITPINRVIIAHTATTSCTFFDQCSNAVRSIQTYHMTKKKFDDIGLNFLVGGDGRAYEGRGYHVGAHTIGYNFDSICISFIGNFDKYEAPKRQLAAAQKIIEDGITANKIVPEYALFGQIQLNGFDSPGQCLYNQIKSWSRWSNVTHT